MISKRTKRWIAVLCSALLLICVAAAATSINADKQAQKLFSQGGIDKEEKLSLKYVRNEETTKAPQLSYAVWIGSDSKDKTLGELGDSPFDTVFADCSETGEKKTADFLQKLKKKKKSVIAAFELSGSEEKLLKICATGSVSGILMTGFQNGSLQAAERLYAAVKQSYPHIRVCMELPYDGNMPGKALKSCCDMLYTEIPCDIDRKSPERGNFRAYSLDDCKQKNVFDAWVELWNRRCLSCGLKMLCGVKPFETEYADTAVLQAMLAGECESISGIVCRGFSGYSKDKSGAASALQIFLNDGINTKSAFCRLSFADYDGTLLHAKDARAEIKIKCSTLFPLFIDGKRQQLPASNDHTVTVELNAGENTVTISQNGIHLLYRAEYSVKAKSPLITFTLPQGEVHLNGRETLELTVGGHILSTVTATLAGQTVTLEKSQQIYGEYTTFHGSFILPAATAEDQTVGTVYYRASADGVKAETYTGACVIINGSDRPADTTAATDVPPVTLNSDNLHEPSQDASQTSAKEETTAENTSGAPLFEQTARRTASPAAENDTSYGGTGAKADRNAIEKVVMISSPYAETRPVTPLSNTYVPTFSTLPYGTLDTVVDTAGCSDGSSDNQYYVLGSGRMVQVEDCTVTQETALSDNRLTLNSCTRDADGISLALSTSWRVPFAVSLTPQSYDSGYEGKKYNVTSFTADRISFTFHYTPYADGAMDIPANDIIGFYDLSSDTAAATTTLTLYFKTTGVFYGYSTGYNSDGTLYIKISDKVKPLSGSVVILDPGHGGSDAGALSEDGSVYESYIDMALAGLTAQRLVQAGATVYMTRNGESSVTLTERRAQTEYVKPDLFVSIHCDATPSGEDYGSSAYYYHPWSYAAARSLNDALTSAYDSRLFPGRSNDRGVHFYPFNVCRTTVCPCVLIETAFITNREDCSVLTSAEGENAIADALFAGISNYLNTGGTQSYR